MDFGPSILALGEGERSESFELFARSLDPQWIRQALDATGTVSMRRRKFPAEYALWTVIGMGLLRDRSIEEVVSHLDLVLPRVKHPRQRASVTSSAIVQARDRLGPDPMEALFKLTSDAWTASAADKDRWRGLSVYGIDGSSMRVADTPENDEEFGRPGTGRDPAAYPQVRLVALMALRSHLLAGLSIGAWSVSEVTLADGLLEHIPETSLTVLDRGFVSYAMLQRIATGAPERHWLIPAKKNLKWKVLEQLGTNDQIVEVAPTRPSRRKHPELPETITMRAVRYQRRGFQPRTLLTSLLDPDLYPADEIIELYHERWEIEIGFDELKTHTLERLETLRSRAPKRVRQEIWGLAIGYNLVRLEMQRVADQAGVPPSRISYRHTLMLVRVFWTATAWLASPGVLRHRLDALHQEVRLLILPPRRTRSYPRAVKIKMSGYPRKR